MKQKILQFLDKIYIYRLFRNAFITLKDRGPKLFVLKIRDYILKHVFSINKDYDINLRYQELRGKGAFDYVNNQTGEFNYKPKISILMPVWNVDVKYLEKAINSVLSQTYTNWELCIVDDYSTVGTDTLHPYMKEIAARDDRVKLEFSPENNHISITTNKCFDLSSGDYIYLMDNDDEISPACLWEHVKVLNDDPDVDLIYADEDKIDMSGKHIDPFFKPDFSPELLLSMMYPTRALMKSSLFESAGKMRKGYEGSQDYDLILRATEKANKIYHLPKILYHWRKIPGSTADEISHKSYAITSARKALEDALERRSLQGEIKGESYPFKTELEIVGEPSVEIILPTKDNLGYLSQAIESVKDKSTYKNYKITIVNNRSEKPETLQYFEKLKSEGINIIDYDKPFNYSAINNFAVSKSEADYLLFLNNDTKVITENWIEEMLMWAQQNRVGAVGAKLIYSDHLIQHAGIIFSGTGGVRLAYQNFADNDTYYFNNMNCTRNYLAVTAACLLVSREKYLAVGGMDEETFAVAYNDVDFCLKLYEKGWRNVYTPHAKLYHYESRTRDPRPSEIEFNGLKSRWGKYFDYDPYYNINFNPDADACFRI